MPFSLWHLCSDVLAGAMIQRSPLSTLPLWQKLAGATDRLFAFCNRIASHQPLWILAIALLLGTQSWLTLSHNHWFDEWQALLIAARSPDIGSLLDNLHYEGHPPLWHLILRMAATALPLAAVLPGIQLVIGLSTQLLILTRAPFERFERLLVGSSYFILFEFGTVSRSLSLGALMMIAFFAVRSRGARWALIILLPMVDFQFGLFSVLAIILMIRDGKWSSAGAGLWVISGLLAAWTVIPASDLHTTPVPVAVRIVHFVDFLSPLLIPAQTQENTLAWSGGLPWALGLMIGPLFIAFSLAQAFTTRVHGLIFIAFLAGCAAFSIAVYPLGVRHLTLIALLLILLKWREVDQQRLALGAAFRIWLVVIALGGVSSVAISATRPFDRGADVARYIKSHGLENKNWVSWRPERGAVVGALLGQEVAMLDGSCRYSFVRWNFHDTIQTPQAVTAAAKRYAMEYGRSYLLTSLHPKYVSDPFLRPVAYFAPGYDGYAYTIYIIGPDLPENEKRPPRCPYNRLSRH